MRRCTHLIGPFYRRRTSVDVVALVNKHLVDCLECDDERAAIVSIRSEMQNLKSELDPPEGFLDRLKESVERRRKIKQINRDVIWRYAVPFAVAASIVICFVPHPLRETKIAQSVPIVQHFAISAPQLYSYEQKLQQSSKEPQEFDVRLAPQLVGFTPQPPTFKGWQLIKTSVVSIKSAKGIKYCYSQMKHGSVALMSCYQFPNGMFDGFKLSHHVIDGRNICCGTRDKISLVYWSDSKKDFVLASQISRADLMDIALQS